MIKKLIFLLATIGVIANVTGCTSKSSQDDSEIVENATVDKIDAESGTAATDLTATPSSDDASLQAALGETSTAPTVDTATTAPPMPTEEMSLDGPAGGTSTAATEPVVTNPDIAAAPTLDETSLNDIPPPSDSSVAALAETPVMTEMAPAPAPVEEMAPIASNSSSSLSSSSSFTDMASAPAPKPGSQLKKVSSTTPYQAGTGYVNTVYVARPGEKLKDISQKIYGSDKSKDLKKIAENSYLKARSVKAGDKVYYVSPNRPEDSSKMLLYYEDMGMVPETYVAKKGDHLKKVSKELLGYDKAWIEVWTSNGVESKDKLAEGDTIRYWRSASNINTTTLAQNTPPTSQPQDTGAGGAQLIDQNQMPTPPPPDMNAGAGAPPPNPQANTGAPPPPPPDMNTPPPPPPDAPVAAAPAAKVKKPGAEEETPAVEGLDQDTMLSLGAVGVLTIALAFVLIRRRKKRVAEQQMTEHDVGT